MFSYDVTDIIYSYLDYKDLILGMLVCKDWFINLYKENKIYYNLFQDKLKIIDKYEENINYRLEYQKYISYKNISKEVKEKEYFYHEKTKNIIQLESSGNNITVFNVIDNGKVINSFSIKFNYHEMFVQKENMYFIDRVNKTIKGSIITFNNKCQPIITDYTDNIHKEDFTHKIISKKYGKGLFKVLDDCILTLSHGKCNIMYNDKTIILKEEIKGIRKVFGNKDYIYLVFFDKIQEIRLDFEKMEYEILNTIEKKKDTYFKTIIGFQLFSGKIIFDIILETKIIGYISPKIIISKVIDNNIIFQDKIINIQDRIDNYLFAKKDILMYNQIINCKDDIDYSLFFMNNFVTFVNEYKTNLLNKNTTYYYGTILLEKIYNKYQYLFDKSEEIFYKEFTNFYVYYIKLEKLFNSVEYIYSLQRLEALNYMKILIEMQDTIIKYEEYIVPDIKLSAIAFVTENLAERLITISKNEG